MYTHSRTKVFEKLFLREWVDISHIDFTFRSMAAKKKAAKKTVKKAVKKTVKKVAKKTAKKRK
jgi:hypothetical protein